MRRVRVGAEIACIEGRDLGTFSKRSIGETVFFATMAVNPLRGIGSCKWNTDGQHLVQRDAERVEIASIFFC
jgi:hypothetical protein